LAGIAPEAPAEMRQIVTRALKKDRAERYQNVKDMALDLKMLLRELERLADAEFSATPNPRATPTLAPELVDTTPQSPTHTASGKRPTAGIVRRLGTGGVLALATTAIVALLLLAFIAGLRFFDSRRANPQSQAAVPHLKITRLTPDL